MIDEQSSLYDAEEQLELLKAQCEKISPKVYCSYALYLQIIRSILPNVIYLAIFNILEISEAKSLPSISDKSKKDLQENIDLLIKKCLSFLTIEHISDLAFELDNDKRVKMSVIKDQILADLNKNENYESNFKESIDLEARPSLLSAKILEDWRDLEYKSKDEDFHHEAEQTYFFKNNLEIESINSFDDNFSKDIDNSDHKSLNNQNELTEEGTTQIDILRNLFNIASDTLEESSIRASANKDEINYKDTIPSLSKGDKGILPNKPNELLNWVISFEFALSKRLRNLSHSINLELLRYGILNNHVPVALLDAAIEGQLSSNHSPTNILKFTLPVTSSDFHHDIDVICLLLKCSDLEFDNAKLRNSKTQLIKYRRFINTMARKEKHWLRRQSSKEVYKSWWKRPLN